VRLALIVASSVVAVLAVAVLGLFLWLRTYAPLSVPGGSVAPGPGLGADVEPTFGSGGKTVFIPIYRKGHPFDVAFTIQNTGRFAVTLTSADTSRVGPLYADKLFTTDNGSAAPEHLHAFRELRLDPKQAALIAVEWQLDCAKTTGEATTDHLRLRYRYLSMFNRSQAVELPFALTLRCSGGPPASP
jgi:hypothetical protein